MYRLFQEFVLTIYTVVNVIAIVVLVAAFRAPRLARILLSLIFLWGCLAILRLVYQYPLDFLSFDAPAIPLYRNLMEHWFKNHVQPVAISISCLHAMVAVSLLLKGPIYKAGIIGGIIFLVLIAPFGLGSAFPCSLILATAMYVLRKQGARRIWDSGSIPIKTLPLKHSVSSLSRFP